MILRGAAAETLTVDLRPYAAVVPAAVVERLRSARHVLAVSHENPDADTLGASLGLARIVEALGATVTVVCTDRLPPLYQALPGAERVLTDPDPAVAYDLLVLSDCASIERVGAVGPRHRELFERLPRVLIDHHVSNDASGPTDWIDPAAAATCEMTALLAVRLGLPLALGGGALAADLIAGIVTDTATFAHPNATARTLIVAAALLEAGAPLSETSRRFYRSKPTRQLRLFGRVLDRIGASSDGRVIWSTLLDADLAALAAPSSDSEGLIDLLSQSEEAEVAILFKEHGGSTRISVRTKPGGVDATVLTGRFGGGGHARAAGASLAKPVDAARPAVLEAADQLAREIVR